MSETIIIATQPLRRVSGGLNLDVGFNPQKDVILPSIALAMVEFRRR